MFLWSSGIGFHGFSISYAQFGTSLGSILLHFIPAKSLELTVGWNSGVDFQEFSINFTPFHCVKSLEVTLVWNSAIGLHGFSISYANFGRSLGSILLHFIPQNHSK